LDSSKKTGREGEEQTGVGVGQVICGRGELLGTVKKAEGTSELARVLHGDFLDTKRSGKSWNARIKAGGGRLAKREKKKNRVFWWADDIRKHQPVARRGVEGKTKNGTGSLSPEGKRQELPQWMKRWCNQTTVQPYTNWRKHAKESRWGRRQGRHSSL